MTPAYHVFLQVPFLPDRTNCLFLPAGLRAGRNSAGVIKRRGKSVENLAVCYTLTLLWSAFLSLCLARLQVHRRNHCIFVSNTCITTRKIKEHTCTLERGGQRAPICAKRSHVDDVSSPSPEPHVIQHINVTLSQVPADHRAWYTSLWRC